MRIAFIALVFAVSACGGAAVEVDPAAQKAERDRVMSERLAAAAEKVDFREAAREAIEQCVSDALSGNRYQEAMDGLKRSDDFEAREEQLRRSGATVMCNKKCAPAEVIEQGGWVRSQNRPGSYFIWCNERRVYLNGETGRIT